MADEDQVAPEVLAEPVPAVEAVAAPEPVAVMETGPSIWKPMHQEFKLDTDFAGIAASLGVGIESVLFSLESTVQDGVEGQTLSGTVA